MKLDNNMQASNVHLYTWGYRESKTYLAASLFVVGNIALPQICHLVPQGGMMLLPIYFFTLIGAYKLGWKVGLLTAVLSPIVNSALFGMPMPAVLPAILLKSVLLALAAAYVAHRYNKVTVPLMLATVLAYQLMGTLGEWAMKGDLYLALQDFRIGIPGMLLQILGGYALIKYLIRK